MSSRLSYTQLLSTWMADANLHEYKSSACGGRTYHSISANPYPYPNDEEEQSRLATMHAIFRSIWGGNVMVNLTPSARRILDIGTGAGSWAADVAKEFPATKVIGMDISPIIHLKELPKNVEFVFGDLTSDLNLFQDGSIDLAHSRGISTGVKKDQWPDYIAQVFRILKPGIGMAQVSELGQVHIADNSVPSDSLYGQFRRLYGIVLARRSLYTAFDHVKSYFKNAGFVDIQLIARPLYLGDWVRDPKMGTVWEKAREAFIEGLPGLTGCLQEFFDTKEAREDFAERLVDEMHETDYHLYFTIHMVTARKPDVTKAGTREV